MANVLTYPPASDYQAEIQNPAYVFADPELRTATVKTNPIGMPLVNCGGFAYTFYLRGTQGQEWVVRCFKHYMPERQQRYDVISGFLAGWSESYFVKAAYFEQGICINGMRFPIVKMPRVTGETLGIYIERNIQTPNKLSFLPDAFQKMIATLQRHGIAHGDLQHGNIIVNSKQQLVLIDYDGLYLPRLQGKPPGERGHDNYQHPERNSEYDATLDRFSSIAIYLALKALAQNPSLWAKYSNGENILLMRQDFLEPDSSALLSTLEKLPDLCTHVQNFRRLCKMPLAATPDLFTFLDGQVSESRVRHGPRIVAAGPAYPVIDARNRSELLEHEGDLVTVIGRIEACRNNWTRYGTQYYFLNFGDYRQGCLALVFWQDALDLFPRDSTPSRFDNQWVTVTGLVSVYDPQQKGRLKQPQIVVEQPTQVQVLVGGAAQAGRLLAGQPAATSVPAPSPPVVQPLPPPTLNKPPSAPPTPAGPQPGAPSISQDNSQTLNKIYAGFPTTSKAPVQPPSPVTPRPPTPLTPPTPAPWTRTPQPLTSAMQAASRQALAARTTIEIAPKRMCFTAMAPDQSKTLPLILINNSNISSTIELSSPTPEIRVHPSMANLLPGQRLDATVTVSIPLILATALQKGKAAGTVWLGPATDGKTFYSTIGVVSNASRLADITVEAVLDFSPLSAALSPVSALGAPGAQGAGDSQSHTVWNWLLVTVGLILCFVLFMAFTQSKVLPPSEATAPMPAPTVPAAIKLTSPALSSKAVAPTLKPLITSPTKAITITLARDAVVMDAPATQNTNVVGVVKKGTTVTLIGRTNDSTWVKVQENGGRQGWINASRLADDADIYSAPVISGD